MEKVDISKRLLVGAAIAFLASSGMAQQSYPTKPIRMVIPLAAGSAVDAAARIVMQKAAEGLGQPVYIENVTGASGAIGADKVAKAPADGYTIGGFNDSVLVMIPHLLPALTWDPLTSFAPISLVATVELGMIVKQNSPYKTLADLIAAAKAKPGEMTFSSGGNGSPQHIGMAMLASSAGLKVRHIPYKGATPAALAVAAGEVDMSVQGVATAAPLLQANKVRLIAISGAQRLQGLPEIPTFAESNLPGFAFTTWFAAVAPAGTPEPIRQRLQIEISKAIKDPQVRDQLGRLGVTPRGSSPSEFAADLKEQHARYARLIKDFGIKAE